MNTKSSKYFDQMKQDVLDYAITDEIREEIRNGNREEVEERLNDECWIDDSITGNASGSYFFNRQKAMEKVVEEIDLLVEAIKEFCIDSKEVGERFINCDWEYFDVTIRCYLLGQVISEVLDEIEQEETTKA